MQDARRSAARLFAAALLGTALALPAAAADRRQVPQAREQITLSFAPLVRQAAPTVVSIHARKVVDRRPISPFTGDPFFQRFFGDGFPFGGSRRQIENALGSGVIVRPDGVIVTNFHVIREAQEITVILADRREFDAHIVLADERTDLAVLRIDTRGEELPHLALADSDDLEVGDLVLAIGNPFGVGQTVTSGIVSALARTSVGASDYRFFIQTDAAINPGNSGGALIDMRGRLVGINSAIYSRSGGSLGIGFAVPSNMVRTVVTSAVTGQPLVRPWVGFTGVAVTAELAQSLGLVRPVGVLVESVYRDGPADRAGIRQGDVITAIDGQPVEDSQALRFRLATRGIGHNAEVTLIRDGRETKVSLELIAPPEDPPRDETVIKGRNPLAGATVVNLSPAVAEEVDVAGASDFTGVMVVGIAPDSAAARVGLRPKDIVLAVDDRAIQTVRDLKAAVAQPRARWVLTVRRGGQDLMIQVD